MSLPPPAYNDNPKSFAYPTVHKRWPTIIEGAIADIAAHTAAHPETAQCGEYVTGKLKQLLADFKSDAAVAPFTADEVALKPDLAVYNTELAAYNAQKRVTWLTGPWLYLECYVYQLIALWFKQTQKLQDFDVFERLKTNTFRQLAFGVGELCKRYEVLAQQLQGQSVDADALRLLFVEFVDISLWGNATDLSLLAGNVTLEDIKSVQGAEVRKKNEEKIIANDIGAAWDSYMRGSRQRVDVVLDNSGFELFADLCLALFLLDAGLVQTVVLHCKQVPWFVSDTMPKDFDALVQQLGDREFFADMHKSDADARLVRHFVAKLEAYVAKGLISTQSHAFWTSCENFWAIPRHADLYAELQKSNLVIFKGDLNYRKLTGDLDWPKTTPFTTAVQALATSGLPVLALRTCKADVVVGLPEGLNEKLIKEYERMGNDVGEFWTASGKWAVISYSGGHAN